MRLAHTVRMDRETYIAPIVEAYIPDADISEKLALTQEFWALFDALYAVLEGRARFDSQPSKMVESESRKKPIAAPQAHPNL